MGTESTDNRQLLPEWSDGDLDDATWIAAIEAARRHQFAELADL